MGNCAASSEESAGKGKKSIGVTIVIKNEKIEFPIYEEQDFVLKLKERLHNKRPDVAPPQPEQAIFYNGKELTNDLSLADAKAMGIMEDSELVLKRNPKLQLVVFVGPKHKVVWSMVADEADEQYKESVETWTIRKLIDNTNAVTKNLTIRQLSGKWILNAEGLCFDDEDHVTEVDDYEEQKQKHELAFLGESETFSLDGYPIEDNRYYLDESSDDHESYWTPMSEVNATFSLFTSYTMYKAVN